MSFARVKAHLFSPFSLFPVRCMLDSGHLRQQKELPDWWIITFLFNSIFVNLLHYKYAFNYRETLQYYDVQYNKNSFIASQWFSND